MKYGLKYSFIRTLFGLYVLWLGIVHLHDIKNYEENVKNILNLMDTNFNLEPVLKIVNLHENPNTQFIKSYKPNFEKFKKYTYEIVYLQGLTFIIGGILCTFGFSLSFNFILLGIILDIIFIHNYFGPNTKDQTIKVKALKFVSLLGGIFHLI